MSESADDKKSKVKAAIAGFASKTLRTVIESPLATAVIVGTLAVAVYVVAYPLMVVHYPPITDLPFHASAISILRHYLDPAWHFREQFSLHFLEAPYWAMHALGALFALFMPVVAATRLTTIVLLALLPAGMAVMFHGMRKSPLLGLLGLPFVWNTLSHWGFINFMGAIGLFGMVVGLALMVVDRPSRRRQVLLGGVLLLVFATHIFRFPFALASVVGVGLVMWPATRRWKPLIAPLTPSILALVAWRLVTNKELSGGGLKFQRPDFGRLRQVPDLLFGGFAGTEEKHLANVMYVTVGVLALVCIAGFFAERRWRGWDRKDWYWGAGVTVLALTIAGVFFGMYLSLPMEIGIWWYVYPREIVSTLFVVLGVLPTLPRASWVRLAALAPLGWAVASQGFFVAKNYARFDDATRDFQQIVRGIPPAPRLGYMVFDHSGSTRSTTPFIHMPAWVQAEKGGWLSFHFVEWNAWPMRYRKNNPAVPPLTPLRFEWTPERFDIATRGKFFDWFLVRSPSSPEYRFRADPSIKLVDHVGSWWLLKRDGAPVPR